MKVIITVISLMVVLLQANSVKATVNQNNIIKGAKVKLTLNAVGSNIEFPDIQDISGYPIESTSNMSQSSIKFINGETKQEVSKKKILTFTPDKNITIPSFQITIDGEKLKTNAINITVNKVSAYTPKGDEKFTLQMDSKSKDVFVGQPFLVSIYFSELKGVDLMDFRSQQPNFKSAIAKEIKGEQTYQKGNYIVHQFNYILTPTQEGELTIEPMIARVAERSQTRDNFFGTIFDKPKWSQIVSNSISINVKPLPTQDALVGDFSITKNIDNKSVKVNKPVNLIVNITGDGNLEDFDELNYEIDGVTIYSDDAVVQSKLQGDRLISNYTKKFVFISDHNFTIPSKSFKAFNFKTQKEYSLEIDSSNIEVIGKALQPAVVVQNTDNKIEKVSSSTKESSEKDIVKDNNREIIISIISFLVGILLTLITLKFNEIRNFRFKTRSYKDEEALKILYPYINDNREVESMVRDLYAKVNGDKSIKIDKKRLKNLIKSNKV